MSESAEEQRKRLEKKRIAESDEPLIQCLECPLKFKRVGSHVVQVHGYESVLEYRQEYGLLARETRISGHAERMRGLARNADNLNKGSDTRFIKGGDHAENLKKFWNKWSKRGVSR